MPPVVRARAGSARQKRVKTRAASPGRRPDPVVADRHGDRGVVGADRDLDRLALAVLDGVGDEVAQDALDAARVHVGDRRVRSGSLTTQPGALARGEGAVGVDGPLDAGAQVAGLDLEHRGARVEAGDLEQVAEQRLEAVELAAQQLGRARDGRLEVAARVVDEVAGHPDRRQRGAQLVGHVGDEPLLDAREVLELGDLLLDRGRHAVEGGAEPGEVVLALGPHALVEVALGEALGDGGRTPHRVGHEARHDEGDGADEQDEGGPTEEERLPDEADDLALAVHRVDEVEAVVAGDGQHDGLADDDRPRWCRRPRRWSRPGGAGGRAAPRPAGAARPG